MMMLETGFEQGCHLGRRICPVCHVLPPSVGLACETNKNKLLLTDTRQVRLVAGGIGFR